MKFVDTIQQLRKVDLSEWLDYFETVKGIARGAGNAGPPSPPKWLLRLFEGVAEAKGVPAPLLAALAAVLTGCNVEHVPGGILAAPGPGASAAAFRPTLAGLAARDPQHVARLALDVEAGADHLLDLHRECGDWCRALSLYCGGELRAGEVVGAMVLISLRQIPAEEL